MKIRFSPMRLETDLTVTRRGEKLEINDEEVDFSDLAPGEYQSAGQIGCDLVVGAERDGAGALCVTLILPHGPDAPHALRFPEPVILTEDGPVPLPGQSGE